jgi:hypothetical protein
VRKIAIFLPVVLVAAMGLRGHWREESRSESCAPCRSSVEVDSVEIFPNASYGTEVTVDFHAAPDSQAALFQSGSGTFRGRFHYYQEFVDRYLYLYNDSGDMVRRVRNPDWVRVRK